MHFIVYLHLGKLAHLQNSIFLCLPLQNATPCSSAQAHAPSYRHC